MLAVEWYVLLEEEVVETNMSNTSYKDLFLVDNKFQRYYYAAECLKVFLQIRDIWFLHIKRVYNSSLDLSEMWWLGQSKRGSELLTFVPGAKLCIWTWQIRRKWFLSNSWEIIYLRSLSSGYITEVIAAAHEGEAWVYCHLCQLIIQFECCGEQNHRIRAHQ